MRLSWRGGRDSEDGRRSPDSRQCREHLWRERDVSLAFPGVLCWVCERCAEVNIARPGQPVPRAQEQSSHDDDMDAAGVEARFEARGGHRVDSSSGWPPPPAGYPALE
jgi:hypothetical protein